MANKKKKSKKKSTPSSNVDIKSLLLVVLGIIFWVMIYTEQKGPFGAIVKNFILGGLLGKVAFALPFILILVGIYIVFKDYSKFKHKGLIFFVLLCSVCALFCCWDYNPNDMYPTTGWLAKMGELAARGTEFYSEPTSGGGLLGAILAVPLTEGFSPIVAQIILWGMILISFFLVTGIAFSSILIGIRDFLADSIEKGKEEISYRRELRRQQIEAEEEEEEEEEEDVTPIITTKETKRKARNKKFDEIMAQTEIVDSGKQIAISDLDLEEEEEEVQEEPSSDVEEETEEEEEVQEEEKKAPFVPNEKLKELFTPAPKNEPKPDNRAEVLNLEHSITENYDDYLFPPISLLNEGESHNDEYSIKELREVAAKLQKTLTSFNVDAKVVNVTRGPTVTQYEVQPNSGVKVSKILSLSDDIALNLAAKSIRIEAPIPGKSAVGIEVPNKTKETVYLREVLESDEFIDATSKVTFALGKSIDGEPYVSDIAKMPHMLIAGATGSGKSVCINSILVSLLYKSKPNEVKLLLIDPKVVELKVYEGIPHLLIPVVTDPKKAAGALNWAVQEMVNRYNLFAQRGVRDIRGYNELLNQEGEDGILPQIVIIVDELADLMMVAPSEVEDAICRLAQMARAAGMHMIIATQRPSVDVVTGIIKANIPSRIAFTVASQIDSRTILDMGGAEKLLGKGDMLYFPMGESKPIRIQGTFVSDKEIENIVEFIKEHCEASYNPEILEQFEAQNKPPQAAQEQQDEADELLVDAIDLAVQMGQASASMLQRKFKIGYARAGRIIDQMEERGLVSGFDGSKPRQTLISKEEWEEMKESGVDSVSYEDVEDASQLVDTDEDYSEEDYEEETEEDTEESEDTEDTEEAEEEEEESEDEDTESDEESEEDTEEEEEENTDEEDDEDTKDE